MKPTNKVRLALLSCLFLLILLKVQPNAHAQSLIRDAEIETNLRDWSNPIFQAAGLYADSVELFLISNPELNAFVAGGQNIFLHTGLLQKAETPEQVLAVIAHETGHISGGHLNKQSTQIEAAQIKALAATIIGIGAAVVSSQSDLGILGAAGGADIATRDILTFSRGQERVADQLAVQFMEAINLPPAGAAEFMRILEEDARLTVKTENSYGTTHPLTRSRIQAMDAALARSRHRGKDLGPDATEKFRRMQAKLDGFIEPFKRVMRKYPERDRSISAQYARAIALYRRGNLLQAVKAMDDLIRAEPSNPYFHELKGQALLENGYLPQAAFAYEQAVSLAPRQPLLRAGLSQALINSGERASVHKGLQHINAGLAIDREDASLWRLAATGYGKLGELGWSALCLAEASLIAGDKDGAIRNAGRAQQSLPRSSPGWTRAGDIKAATAL